MDDILQLSIAERVHLAEQIWDSIAAQPEMLPVTEAQRAELDRRLEAGESVSFSKVWGFTVDTAHEHVRYVFRTCWRGVSASTRQCRTQWVDVLP